MWTARSAAAGRRRGRRTARRRLRTKRGEGGWDGGDRREPEQRIVTGYGVVRMGVAEADKQRLISQVAMDRLFGLERPEGDADWAEAERLGLVTSAPRWFGIREAYVQLTGDAFVTG